MTRYLALIEHDDAAGAFGVAVPDCPGCAAMGSTFEDAEANAIAALREWASDHLAAAGGLPHARSIVELRRDPMLADDFTPHTVVVSLPVYLDGGRPVRVNVSMEAGLVAEIDEAARRRGLTRSGFLASAARDKIAGGSGQAPARPVGSARDP